MSSCPRVNDVSHHLFYPVASSATNNATQMTIRTLEKVFGRLGTAVCLDFGRRVDDVSHSLYYLVASSTANTATQTAIKVLGSKLDGSG
jgi:hypothetical protein